MSENTPPSFAIRDNIKTFTDLTGIEVRFSPTICRSCSRRSASTCVAARPTTSLNYVQDKPIGAPFADFYADLTPMFGDDTLPQDPEGYGDDAWFENFLSACGRFYEKGKIVALPYDAAIACTFYRQDLFEANSKDFEAEYGYRLEFTKDSTWKNVTDMAAFFKKAKEAGKDVPYGYAQHQGSFAWTTQLDIQRFLFANGRWMEWNIDDVYGSKKPGKTNWGDEQSIAHDDEVQGTGGRLPSGQPRQRHARTEHGLPVRQYRDADAVSRVRGLDRGREHLARGRRQDRLCALPEG